MIRPSDYELKLLRHLWRCHRLSAREIHEASAPETGWSYSATRKTLDRMVEKGLVIIEMVHGLKTYVATHSKLRTLAAMASAFARDVLDVDVPLPAATFANSRLVSADEISELEDLLAELAAKPGEAEGDA
ncbi:MAG: BlaI/MecI/CopY family transcriptional regulator [Asticcacaulis sp.]|nr:BlaI/MecI/CopY family transcriptional regulator [Asticcacaulis sp.]